MKGKVYFNWVFALFAAIALSISTLAAQRAANDENVTKKAASAGNPSSKSAKININTASKEELETLPGVGPSTADNIIAARPFKTIKQLKEVSGIGEQRLKEIRPHVTIGSTASRSSNAKGAPSSASTSRAAGSEKPKAKAQSRQPDAREKEESRGSRSRTSGDDNASARSSGTKVNINTASQEELESLLGIGPVKAQAIIDNRPYSKPEDVMKVSGIKEGIYEQIRDQITVR